MKNTDCAELEKLLDWVVKTCKKRTGFISKTQMVPIKEISFWQY
jgi:hypothetical protein